jgi:hypothetical protein
VQKKKQGYRINLPRSLSDFQSWFQSAAKLMYSNNILK